MKDYGYKIRKVFKKKERLSKNKVWEFWKTAAKESTADNSPNNYIKGKKRSVYLVNLIAKYLNKKSKILEIGCNVGRNLEYLHKNNFQNLTGVEINKEAIKLMRKTYPNLYKAAKIYISPVEDWMMKNKQESFDLIYTIAVLEHIHWDSEFIFDIIKKISKKYIITIEDEFTPWSNRHFPRNYKNIFEDASWKQIYNVNCGSIDILDDRFIVRVFEKFNNKEQ